MNDLELTREQREAWRVVRPLIMTQRTSSYQVSIENLDEAAARFDEMEETCGIEPLSEAHAWLILVCADSTFWDCKIATMLRPHGLYKDEGGLQREECERVLAALNRKCGVK